MNYPLISEYIEAIKAAEDNFEQLSYLRPVLDDDGLPVMTSGNFAVVFKMKDERDEKYFAVKCFTKEQEGREEAYHQITEELKNVSSPYLTSVRYLDKELFVDTDQTNETEFPVLLMDWVEGLTLDKYFRANLDDKFALEMLAYRFSQLAQWLIPQPFAHGDLKPDNILVREDGTLVLVDYDGMYVPAMKGQKARELGSPDFRHPKRTENDFDERIDDFPLVSILLSLKATSINPQLLEIYGTVNSLLLSQNDYSNIHKSHTINLLFHIADFEIKVLVSTLILLLKSAYSYCGNALTICTEHEEIFDLFNWLIGHKYAYISTLQTTCSIEELNQSTKDEDNLVYYDRNGYKLLKAYDLFMYHLDECHVREGCRIICDNAFRNCPAGPPKRIWLPDSIINIGIDAFTTNSSPTITEIIVPDGQIERFSALMPQYSHLLLEESLMTEATKEDINEGNKDHQGCVYSKDGRRLLYCSKSWEKEVIQIDEGIIIICDSAFEYLGHIYGSITSSSLSHVHTPKSLQIIGRGAFYGCSSLTNIIIPNSVTRISSGAFCASGLISICIPESVVFIDIYAFAECPHLKKVTFLGKSTIVDNDVFSGSNMIQIIEVPMGAKEYYSKVLFNYSHLIVEGK